MRRIFINVLAFGVVGTILDHMGFGIATWQYWSCIGLLLVVQVNSAIE